ncbi:MAG: hypothetical protein E7602_00240 [Ruminococcaceae bacterium]|nr:hypothetical protein [Oscillospiraceae bacterium]
MSLREKITQSILQRHPIPTSLQNSHRPFYYKDYRNNLFCPMSSQTIAEYNRGDGSETKESTITKFGRTYTLPPKMGSIVSSSAMTFNLFGNDSVSILPEGILPQGTYTVEYEKQLLTRAYGNMPANVDAFLSDSVNRNALFFEMKNLEWLESPKALGKSYFMERYYFTPDRAAVPFPKDAFEMFSNWAHLLQDVSFRRYDASQMFKHTLAMYNYASFVTRSALEKVDPGRTMAGKYDWYILTNVVNEFPAAFIDDEDTRWEYQSALSEERYEAQLFIDTMHRCEIPAIFDNNCNAGIKIIYMSAKELAESLDIPVDHQEYLKRYYS